MEPVPLKGNLDAKKFLLKYLLFAKNISIKLEHYIAETLLINKHLRLVSLVFTLGGPSQLGLI